MLDDHGWSGSVTICPFSTRLAPPEDGSWRVAPAETLRLGMNAAYAERTPESLIRFCPCAWITDGAFRRASATASSSVIGRGATAPAAVNTARAIIRAAP